MEQGGEASEPNELSGIKLVQLWELWVAATISRVLIHCEYYARLHQGSLASLAHTSREA